MWLDTISPFLKQASPKSIQQWGKNFIDSLLSLTHKQWIFRNSKVHFKTDGLTATQHDALETRVKELMSTLPSALLAKDRYISLEDFHLLGEGPAAIRQVWVTSMESALGGDTKYAAGLLVSGSHPYLQSLLHRPHCFTRKSGVHAYVNQLQLRIQLIKPHNPPNRRTTHSHHLSSIIYKWYAAAGEAHIQRYGDIRRRRCDTGSCIYRKDWQIK